MPKFAFIAPFLLGLVVLATEPGRTVTYGRSYGISRTPNEIELRNEHGRCYRFLSNAEALALDLDLYVVFTR